MGGPYPEIAMLERQVRRRGEDGSSGSVKSGGRRIDEERKLNDMLEAEPSKETNRARKTDTERKLCRRATTVTVVERLKSSGLQPTDDNVTRERAVRQRQLLAEGNAEKRR